jgi:endo-1,4-beta-xylanase
MIQRRSFLFGAAAAGGGFPPTEPIDTPLRQIAASRNILFGSAVTCTDLDADPFYPALIARECAIITPGIEGKWGSTEPEEGKFNFGPMDRIAGFAHRQGLRLHMHNLIWAVRLPRWTLDALASGRGRQVMNAHIAAVAGRYRGQVHSWDVVNEPIDPRWPADADGICTTPWRLGVGKDFIAAALAETSRADPSAHLMINDDDLEYDAPDREQKRNFYLRLIETLLRHNVPLHGFGLEVHLKPWLPIAEKSYRRFLHNLADFGLKLHHRVRRERPAAPG